MSSISATLPSSVGPSPFSSASAVSIIRKQVLAAVQAGAPELTKDQASNLKAAIAKAGGCETFNLTPKFLLGSSQVAFIFNGELFLERKCATQSPPTDRIFDCGASPALLPEAKADSDSDVGSAYNKPAFRAAVNQQLLGWEQHPSSGAPLTTDAVSPKIQQFVANNIKDQMDTTLSQHSVNWKGQPLPVVLAVYGGMAESGATAFSPSGTRLAHIIDFKDN